ncbi:hypothetical protein T06_16326 [Trichinella sp. T6]|nr:hypothetical protein T06_16326 [Trichinella sp. T6]
MEKKEWRQITTAQKLQIIQTVDENPNMKRIDIARMMKIPSSRLNTVRRYVYSFNVDENVINQLSKIDTRDVIGMFFLSPTVHLLVVDHAILLDRQIFGVLI